MGASLSQKTLGALGILCLRVSSGLAWASCDPQNKAPEPHWHWDIRSTDPVCRRRTGGRPSAQGATRSFIPNPRGSHQCAAVPGGAGCEGEGAGPSVPRTSLSRGPTLPLPLLMGPA